ncbi:uncharacterized protein Dwil_GK15848 [Drosophila willistoni]|uniref:Flavin-containing monooxygenase n=1 Tax=Drosophila willistoni TaxID=7260 RepID=B4MRM1_DROWI|nr:senecionine N-oxygenase [Drosophila willistoni]EDW74760.1 uncharacterized protein Dwil_GK15848 [Drosophila willistoni]
MSVCIIGAGTAGLSSARHAKQHGLNPTIFELSDKIGGTWVYNEKTGSVNGIDIHSSMYTNLRTNLPKEIMGFPDYEIGENEKSYIKSEEILDFLNQFADHFELRNHVRFNSYVIRVLKKRKKWQVLVKNVVTNQMECQYFDYVMVANGHYHTPNYVQLKNGHLFQGEYLHSHDFRHNGRFKDKTVLVIGAGPSGLDLSNIISKAAKRVFLSHHLEAIENTKFFENVSQKPDVRELDEAGGFFVDGSYEEFDTIFFCTGYKYAFPFLTVNSGIFVEDNCVQVLYKQCLNAKYPSMALIGLPFYVCAAQMMDLQARFVLSYFTGKNELPSTEDMRLETAKSMQTLWEKGYRKRQAHMLGVDQINYFTDLAETAKVKNIRPVMAKLHNESSNHFKKSLLNFRENIFKIVDDETFVQVN